MSGALCNLIIISFILWSVPFTAKGVKAQEISPVYAGEAMATGMVFVTSGSGQGFSMDSYPTPLFDKSRIQTNDGAAVISLVPGGLIEVHKNSEVLFHKTGDRNFIEVARGMVRFSVPSQNVLSITIPSAGVSIGGQARLASKGDSLPSGGAKKVGVVVVEKDGATSVSSMEGSLEVSTGDNKTMVLRPGETIRLAGAETASGGGLTDELTVSRLSALSAQKGIKVFPTVKEVPALAEGEVAIAIPANIGGGFIAGTPEAIAAGLNAIGIATTEDAVMAADARVYGFTPAGAGAFGFTPAVVGLAAVGVVAIGIAAASASPSIP
ncbi:MAG: FecR domain-containing protein [Deltaproteobacteria bacterium]|nr:FecR domain-containing protein [Deltaproteobacteria bacterium]